MLMIEAGAWPCQRSRCAAPQGQELHAAMPRSTGDRQATASLHSETGQ